MRNTMIFTHKNGNTLQRDHAEGITLQQVKQSVLIAGGVISGGIHWAMEDIAKIEKSYRTDMSAVEFLRKLSDAVAEKRSDISEVIQNYLERGEDYIDDSIEHRFIKAKIPVGNVHLEVEYDTLTTHISYKTPVSSDWIVCDNEEYFDITVGLK